MTLEEIIEQLNLTLITKKKDFNQVIPTSGYSSDLLSCVLASAPNQALWVTLQTHANVVAVGALLELSAVIITENATPDEGTIAKANQDGVTLLSTNESTFHVIGRLWELGLRDR